MIIVLTFTLRQQHIPQAHLGKVITIAGPIAFLPVPMFSTVAGYVLGRFERIVPLAVMGALVLFVSMLVGMRSQFVKLTNTTTGGAKG